MILEQILWDLTESQWHRRATSRTVLSGNRAAILTYFDILVDSFENLPTIASMVTPIATPFHEPEIINTTLKNIPLPNPAVGQKNKPTCTQPSKKYNRQQKILLSKHLNNGELKLSLGKALREDALLRRAPLQIRAGVVQQLHEQRPTVTVVVVALVVHGSLRSLTPTWWGTHVCNQPHDHPTL